MNTCSPCIYSKQTNLSSYKKGRKGLNIFMRPLCNACLCRPAAVNYHKHGRIYYRKLCETCIKHGEAHGIPFWYRSGYRMKNSCDKCGFKSTHAQVFNVFHIDGDLTNCRPANLKTICANCQRVLHKEGIRWRQGALVPDL